MNDDWPREAVSEYLYEIMGKQGAHQHPLRLIRTAHRLYRIIVSKLQLRSGSLRKPVGELLTGVLRAVVDDETTRNRADWSSVKAAAELLGVEVFTDKEIETAIHEGVPSWLKDDDLAKQRKVKPFRLYLALLAEGEVRTAQKDARDMQRPRWAPAMADALHNFLTLKAAEAQQIALELGLELAERSDGRADAALPVEELPSESSVAPPARSPETVGERQGSTAHDRIDRLTNSPIPYVRRASYHRTFNKLVADGEKLIALVGEPGNGKTRLADELVAAKMQPGETRINLRALDGAVLMNAIAGVLGSARIRAHQMRDAELERAFATYICSPDAPDCVVMDNVVEDGQLDRLFPPMMRSIVVVTSREDLLPKGRGVAIEVKAMERNEAVSLASHLLPEASRGDIALLTSRLGNRPLAIEHVAKGLLFGGNMTMQEFDDAFQVDVGSVMHESHDRPDETYDRIYAEILANIEASDERAAWLLRFIAFLSPDNMPLTILQAALQLTCPPKNPKLGPVAFQSALRQLQAKYLIKTDVQTASIHPFTQSVLRSILQDRAVETCLHFHEVFRQAFLRPKVDGTVVDNIEILPHLVSLVLGLENASAEEWRQTGLGKTVAILLRSLQRSGGALRILDLENLVTRGAEPEMAAIRTDPDWQEVNREWIAILDAMGELDDNQSLYAAMSSYFDSFLDEQRSGWSRLRDFMRAMHIAAEAGQRTSTLDTLVEIKAASTEMPTFFTAELEYLAGKIQVELGRWGQANTSLRRAMELYARVNDDRKGESLVGQARTRKCALDLLIFSAPFDKDILAGSLMTKWQELLDQAGDRAPLVRAYFWHSSARLAAAHLNFQHFSSLRDGVEPSRVYENNVSTDEKYAFLVKALAQSADSATQIYATHSMMKSASELLYDIQISSVFIASQFESLFPTGSNMVKLLIESASKSGRLQYELADLKVRIILGKIDSKAVSDLRAMAYKFAYEHELTYWYCEGLVSACGAAILIGESFEPMLAPLGEALEDLGRLDRWNELARAIDEYQENRDGNEFRRSFSYFLTY